MDNGPAIVTGQPGPFDLNGRVALVVGLGESGLAMARWAAFKGATVRVVDTREAPPQRAALRAHLPEAVFDAVPDLDERLLDGADVLLWSPGLSVEVGASARLYASALARGLPVLGEIEVFAQALSGLAVEGYAPKVVAITGTNGKTTTTRLVAHLCAHAGRRVAVAGNIAPAALDVLRSALVEDLLPEVWVLELSSFQLALTECLRVDAASVLNVSQDHLDWHASAQSYLAAKQRIYRCATARVFNRDDAATVPVDGVAAGSFGLSLPTAPGEWGVALDGGLRWLAQAFVTHEPPAGRRRREPVEFTVRRLMPADAMRLRGAHNHANALAALALATAIGIPMAAMLHGLRSFEADPHRCELVAVIRDVEYYDDSKGTNVGASVAALSGLGRTCVLIAGGDGKGQDFAPLADAVGRHARAVMLIGQDVPALKAALAPTGIPVETCTDLDDAVRRAAQAARPGDAVLLSPACASLDMFRNYVHRAEVFVAAVRALAEDAGVPC